jgi:hypothetical protein
VAELLGGKDLRQAQHGLRRSVVSAAVTIPA